MAFLGRGNMPSINSNNNIDGDQDNNSGNWNQEDFFRHYSFHHRIYYYVPLDNTYVAMSIILTFIILIVGVIAYVVTYKSTIIDPIESVKKTFLNVHLIITFVLLGATIITNLSSKNESILIKRLMIIFVIYIITMLVFLGIKLHLDTTYTKEQFEQLYTGQNIGEDSDTKSKINMSLTGMSIKSEKEYYVDQCMKLYNIFKIKTYATLGLHLLLNILLIFQMQKVIKIHNKKIRMNKDDLILFDEEQNIRY